MPEEHTLLAGGREGILASTQKVLQYTKAVSLIELKAKITDVGAGPVRGRTSSHDSLVLAKKEHSIYHHLRILIEGMIQCFGDRQIIVPVL